MARIPLCWSCVQDLTEKNVLAPISGTKQCRSERRFEKLDFHWPPQGPHFLVLCPRLGRKHWPPPPLLKKTRPALRLVWRCWIFVAHGRDLTFSAWAPHCGENICSPTTLLRKTRQALRLVWKYWIFVARDRDLTFSSWVPDWGEHICPHTPG